MIIKGSLKIGKKNDTIDIIVIESTNLLFYPPELEHTWFIFQLTLYRFEIRRKLGQGTYGKVQLGINKETSQEVRIQQTITSNR